ncbi:LysR family transcriptional regulator [Nocardioides sp. SYSU D00065]|uniref:LysR family transcriptional regulator n=1 Tax=Nocardioides sp. SYSU D00065 TaxID=2817378 RepID=UPI001B31D8A7|nr:LysR family transcriptional regulator [Nocardioides sp. SYSU D00065]
MERRQLQYFLAIADAGSFTRAASRLNVAQPSLSAAMRSLEDELGTELFERHGRGVRLTETGRALVAPARRTVRAFHLAAGAVRAAAGEGYGRLVIVSSTLWVVEPLVAVLGEFRRLHAAAQLVVTDPHNRSDVLEQVRAGDADIGVVEGLTPLTGAPPGILSSQPLGEQELVAVLPPGPEAAPASVSVADVSTHGLISTPAGTAMRTLLDEQLAASGSSAEVEVETAHVASVVPLVLARAGATILPRGMAALAAAQGARIAQLEPAARADLSLVWRTDRLSQLGEHLVLLAADHLGTGASATGDEAPVLAPLRADAS